MQVRLMRDRKSAVLPPAEEAASRPDLLQMLRTWTREEALPIKVQGSCMSPLLSHGDRVEVKAARLYWPGDVLVFQSLDGQVLAHRLIGWYPRRRRIHFLTQSDSAERPDRGVTSDRILGVVRGGGSPLIARVPMGHRLVALKRFLVFLGRRLVRATA